MIENVKLENVFSAGELATSSPHSLFSGQTSKQKFN